MRRRSLLVVAVVLVLLVVGAHPASAEVFVDLYLGGAFTADHDLTAQFGSTTLQVLEDVEYDASVLFGGRIGYWFERPLYDRLAIGLALDVFWFQPDIDSQTVSGSQTSGGVTFGADFLVFPIDVSVVGVGLDLMLRWPVLPSSDFPRGRLQPYLTVGPTLFYAEAEDSGNFTPNNQSDTDTSIGVKVGLGVAYHLSRNLAVFGETRFTYFNAEWDFTDSGVGGTVETDFNTLYMLVGLSYRF
jgi:opacity protein-like surface antigen